MAQEAGFSVVLCPGDEDPDKGAGDVYVALSTGTSFTGTALKWHDHFGLNGETTL
ncbi:hypothetical protein ACQSSU_26150 [Micromonospora echinospora]